jgi:hypothetical protein
MPRLPTVPAVVGRVVELSVIDEFVVALAAGSPAILRESERRGGHRRERGAVERIVASRCTPRDTPAGKEP